VIGEHTKYGNWENFNDDDDGGIQEVMMTATDHDRLDEYWYWKKIFSLCIFSSFGG